MVILGIETTCDETGVAVVKDGRSVLSNIISSSVDFHKSYGGVVPEIAAREQVKALIPAIDSALSLSKLDEQDIDAIAVASGPGLVGGLLVGVETAKALALLWNKPLVSVNHLIGHIYANWLTEDASKPAAPAFPLIALIVSGGHTDLILMKEHGKYKWLGGTLDDSAGEAFDKVAKVLGLYYPGGPQIQKLADGVIARDSLKLPRPLLFADSFDFSFSGLKTAVNKIVNGSMLTIKRKKQIASEFQKSVCDVLVNKTFRAAKEFGTRQIVVGGGVAANALLRLQFTASGNQLGIKVCFPRKEFSVDNGAMIASAGFFNFRKAKAIRVNANPGLHFSYRETFG